MPDEKNLPLGHSFLGLLNSKLRELQGFATLAYELIQNAEDAVGEIAAPSEKQATLVFRVDENALVADNEAVFSDCARPHDIVCPWKVDGRRSCDFHGFREIGAGEKRQANSGLKGAFGFGFTAVYQVADHPELISNGRHWIIHIEEAEQDRIQPCKDLACACRKPASLPGTRFILPWAKCSTSDVRKALGSPAIKDETPRQIIEALQTAIPRAILFLDHIRTIEVYWKSELIVRVSSDKTPESTSSFTIIANDVRTKWMVLSHDFEDVAKKLQLSHPPGEKKPSSVVKIAIPEHGMDHGLLYSFLPTQISIKTPFHINADFFPSSDRKRILLERDYQGDWNRAAVSAGAIALKNGLLSLREHLGPTGFWDMLQTVRQTASDSDSLLGKEYWTQVASMLSSQLVVPVVPTASASEKVEWSLAAEARLVPKSDDVACPDLCRELHIRAVHPDVLGHKDFLISRQVGVPSLSSIDLASQLNQQGFTGTKSQEELPKWFQALPNRKLLWQWIGSVLKRDVATDPLSACSFLHCTDGKFRSWKTVFKADLETRLLFQPLNSESHFFSDNPDMLAVLNAYIQDFKLPDAISAIGSCLRQETENTASNIQADKILTKEVSLELLKWLNQKPTALRMGSGLLNDLRKLAICPTTDGLKSFNAVVLPGDFYDPIGVTSVADVAALNTVPELKALLKLEELTLRDYIQQRLPSAFKDGKISIESCGKLLSMLSMHQRSIELLTDASEVRDGLRKLRFIPCSGGELRSIDDGLYFDTPLIRGILADTVCYVEKAYCLTEINSLLKWLGVADQPRLKNVVAYMLSIVKQETCPTKAANKSLVTSLDHLNSRTLEIARQTELLNPLKVGEWVPAEVTDLDSKDSPPTTRQKWCVPSEVCFFDTVLGETTGRRVLFSDDEQTKYRTLFNLVGVRSKPDVSDVIKDWQRSATIKSPVSIAVYRFINEALEKDKTLAAQLQELKTSECLFDSTRQLFFSPAKCFAKAHPFGSFREVLGDDVLRTLSHLLAALEVREIPTWQDAMDVIGEISRHESVKLEKPVTEDWKNVLNACWRSIQKALHDKSPSTEVIKMRLQAFSNLPVVCGHNNIIVSPRTVFFRDREKYAEAFSPSLDAVLISMSPKADRDLTVAGVRKLSKFTSLRIIQDDQSRKEGTLELSRLQERSSLLINLIEWRNPKRRNESLPDFLSMKVYQLTSLKVEFTFSGTDNPQKVVKEEFAAFDDSENTLWYCLEDGKTPWASIAFELARTFVNGDEIASLSAFIRIALEPDSVTKAKNELRHLGLPKIELCDEEPLVSEASLTLGLAMTLTAEIKTAPTSQDAALPTSPQGHKEANSDVARPRTPCEPRRISNSERPVDRKSPYISTDDAFTNTPDVHNNEDLTHIEGDERFTEFLSRQAGASDIRNEKTLSNSSKAGRRESETVPRRKRINKIPRDEVLQYLTSFYADGDRLKCQMTIEGEDMHYMPFWKSRDQMYSGKMELFNREFSQLWPITFPEVAQLHLLLCPNCAALYTRFVATKPEQQMRMIDWVRSAVTGNSFTIDCSMSGRQPNRVLHFRRKHLDDIRHTDGVFVVPQSTELGG